VRFRVAVHPAVLSVPIEAVVKDGDKRMVTKIVEGATGPAREKVEVKLGARNDRVHEVVEGLKEGDILLIDPDSSKENEVEL